jgi:hypothetical protein
MNSSVIKHILTRDPYTGPMFQGFSAADLLLPDKIKCKPALFILNTDTADGPGEHWCAVIIRNKNVCEFFDSYGLAPSVYNFETQLLDHCNKIRFNEFRVQGANPTCGHHCLFFALKRARGVTLHDMFTKHYSSTNLNANDRMVYKYVKRYGDVFSQFAV